MEKGKDIPLKNKRTCNTNACRERNTKRIIRS